MDKRLLKKYYSIVPVIPVEYMGKDPVDKYYNYKRYSVNDINENENIAMFTGLEIFKNRFSVILDIDFDMNTAAGERMLKIISKYCKDTVIVKSGGKHNGLHIHYLTNVPVTSSKTIYNNGVFEIKGINMAEDCRTKEKYGQPAIMMLPPSVVEQKYRVIYPELSDYIDFQKVKQIEINALKRKIQTIKKEIK